MPSVGQIEKVFRGVSENIYRPKSGADLIETLGQAEESLICTLVHKFGGKDDDAGAEGAAAAKAFVEALHRVPPGWKAQGDLHVFLDECQRTQSGDRHKAMHEKISKLLDTPIAQRRQARG
jgi:type I restriction enzyme R subunit